MKPLPLPEGTAAETRGGPAITATDIPQIASKSMEVIPSWHPQGYPIFPATIGWCDFRGLAAPGSPFDHIFRHSDAAFLSFSPCRLFPRPTLEWGLVADRRSAAGFPETGSGARRFAGSRNAGMSTALELPKCRSNVRVGSEVPVHQGCQLRPNMGVKQTFLTECPKLGPFQTFRGRGRNGKN